jgi:hypothetical protein
MGPDLFFSFVIILHRRLDTLDGGSARHKAANYTQTNTNTEQTHAHTHTHPCLDSFVVFRNKLIFYGEELLAQRPTPKLEDHPLSAVRDCLFNLFTATLQNWRESPPSATSGRAMPW